MKKDFEIRINYLLCKNCGICYWVCPSGTLAKGDLGKPVLTEKKCIGCYMCERLCPDFAISVEEVKEEVEENA